MKVEIDPSFEDERDTSYEDINEDLPQDAAEASVPDDMDEEQRRIAEAIARGEAAAEREIAEREAAAAKAAEEAALEGELLDEEAEADEEAAQLDDELAQAKAAAKASEERLLRLMADWENFRQRTAQERVRERERACESLVVDLLPVIDDLERACAHATGKSEELDAFANGVEAVRRKFVDVLGRQGVEQINPQGEAFNPEEHQAVGRIEDAEVYNETVRDVYQLGYKMAGRVIRPAMVTISFGGADRPLEEDPQAKDEESSQ